MISLESLSPDDTALIATALLIAGGAVSAHRITELDRRRCMELASEIRNGLAAVTR